MPNGVRRGNDNLIHISVKWITPAGGECAKDFIVDSGASGSAVVKDNARGKGLAPAGVSTVDTAGGRVQTFNWFGGAMKFTVTKATGGTEEIECSTIVSELPSAPSILGNDQTKGLLIDNSDPPALIKK